MSRRTRPASKPTVIDPPDAASTPPRTPHHLVVFAHPHPGSYTASVCEFYCEALRDQGHTVELRDLYRAPIAGVLTSEEYVDSRAGSYPIDVQREHDALRGADGLTLVFPLWWMGPPALLKGWLDRVLSYGVAYTMRGEESVPLLTDKAAATIVTMGTAVEDYQADHSLEHMQALWNRHIFGFCGMPTIGNVWLGNASLASDDERDGHRERCRALAKRWADAVRRP